MRNIKLIIEYDGTNYHGWQIQPNKVTVQEVIEKAIYSLTGEQCKVIGASRTDAGVHALGQVANFYTMSKIPADKFSFALNRLLPEDVSIKYSEEAGSDFHSRFSAKGKRYRYLIYNSKHRSAIMRNNAFHVSQSLDLQAIKKACSFFAGKHDFAAFRSSGGSAETTVRTITDISVEKKDDIIAFEIAGDGFLYNMVRIIAGTLVYVGLGKIYALDIPDIILSGDRRRAGLTAPPQGLYLVEVYY